MGVREKGQVKLKTLFVKRKTYTLKKKTFFCIPPINTLGIPCSSGVERD